MLPREGKLLASPSRVPAQFSSVLRYFVSDDLSVELVRCGPNKKSAGDFRVCRRWHAVLFVEISIVALSNRSPAFANSLVSSKNISRGSCVRVAQRRARRTLAKFGDWVEPWRAIGERDSRSARGQAAMRDAPRDAPPIARVASYALGRTPRRGWRQLFVIFGRAVRSGLKKKSRNAEVEGCAH